MELSPKQQISELLKQSQSILVVTHKSADGDAVGSMLALERVLTKAGKEVTLVLSEKLDENLTFLPGIEKFSSDITGARDLTIRISKDKFPVKKLTYNEENGFLNIVLTPEKSLDKNNLEFVQGAFKFDLIFVLDTPDVEKIDSVYDRYTELFFETPIVNLDHHSGNEYFGTVNMVDLTATSTAEILVSVIEAMGAGNFDADVATCLLTGIITDTASFKNTNTSPKALTISAQMLAAGARQQEIVQNLYKTRSLSTLKLWGRVLSNMEYDREHRMVVSTIKLADFEETGGNIEEIHGVMDELLTGTPGTDVVLLLAETKNNQLAGKLKGLNGSDVLAIAEAFGGSGQPLTAEFNVMNATLGSHKDTILTKVRQIRDKQLGRKTEDDKEQATNKGQKPTENLDSCLRSSSLSDLGVDDGNDKGTDENDKEETSNKGPETSARNDVEKGKNDKKATKYNNVEVVKQSQNIVIEPPVYVEDLPENPYLPPIFPEQTPELPAHGEVKDLWTDSKLTLVSPESQVASPEEIASLNQFVEEEIAREAEPTYAEIFTPADVATTKEEDDITKALKSIDDEVEGVAEIIPNIDIEGAKTKNEALQQIGEVIRGYNPGRPVEEKGEQPVDPTLWK